ncbi:MAG: phosphotransferase, partial [Acidimicrobiales bacterium]
AASAPATLLHADAWPVNVALESGLVVLLDWAVATAGPAAVDLAVFLTGAADHVDATRDEVIDRFRRAAGPDLAPAPSVQLSLVFGLVDLGWNKALDAAEHDDPAQRRRAAADLAWWCERAGPTLAAGW